MNENGEKKERYRTFMVFINRNIVVILSISRQKRFKRVVDSFKYFFCIIDSLVDAGFFSKLFLYYITFSIHALIQIHNPTSIE